MPPLAQPLVVACAAIWHQERLFLARRRDNGLWELPGGKLKPGESLAQCLVREIQEELGALVEVLKHLAVARQEGPRPIELHCFACRLAQGWPQALEHLELRWVPPGEITGLELCPADRKLAPYLLNPGPAA